MRQRNQKTCKLLARAAGHLGCTAPLSTRNGSSAASHGASPKQSACAMPKCGLGSRAWVQAMREADSPGGSTSGCAPPMMAPGRLRCTPVLQPQRLEVDGQADLAASVHFGRLAVELGYLDLRRDGRVRSRDVKLQAGRAGRRRLWALRRAMLAPPQPNSRPRWPPRPCGSPGSRTHT